jgi:uncharacterized membrane protein
VFRLRDVARGTAVIVRITSAIVFPLLLVLVGAGIDSSYAENNKRMLQDATDAATLTVAAQVAKNPNLTMAQLRAIAQTTIDANFTGTPAPTIHGSSPSSPLRFVMLVIDGLQSDRSRSWVNSTA